MKHLLVSAAFAGLIALQAHAQSISVRTYPILSEDTFVDAPSENRAMGRVQIALDDPLGDGFINPAMLARGTANYLFTLPRFSSWSRNERMENQNPGNTSITEDKNAAWNLGATIGGVARCGPFTAAATAGYASQRNRTIELDEWSQGNGGRYRETDITSVNYPFHLGASWETPCSDVAVGASGSYVHLNGIDGVQFLYPSSTDVKVKGASYDVRLGVAATLGPGALSAVGGRQGMNATHTATYAQEPTTRTNEEKNSTWFAQTRYRLALTEQLGLGFEATGNWREHPKIPDYPIAGIPRDPGTTHAYNFGAGMTWRSEATTVAVEYLIEPIRSDTWVDALQDWTNNGTVVVRKGEVEQRNNYRFLNHIVRAGVKLEPASWLAIRFGSEVRLNSYDYERIFLPTQTRTTSSPQQKWSEVVFSGGIDATFGRVRLLYDGEILMGRGLLDRQTFPWFQELGALRSADFFIIPNAMLSIRPIPVFTNRLTIVYTLD